MASIFDSAKDWLINLTPAQQALALKAVDLDQQLRAVENDNYQSLVGRTAQARRGGHVNAPQMMASQQAAAALSMSAQQMQMADRMGMGTIQNPEARARALLQGMDDDARNEVLQEVTAHLISQGVHATDPEYHEHRSAAIPGAVAIVNERAAKRRRERDSPNNNPAYQTTLTGLMDMWEARHGDKWVDVQSLVEGGDPFWCSALRRLATNELFEVHDGWVRLRDRPE